MQYEHNRRDKHCVSGALTQKQFLYWFSDNLDSPIFECFVRLMLEKFNKILLVMDHASYHASWAMMGFYFNSDRIKILFFPSYSPELDPTEQVWRGTKKWLGIRCWKGKSGLKRELKLAFKEIFLWSSFTTIYCLDYRCNKSRCIL